MQLRGRSVVLTGATGGIGGAIARELGARSCGRTPAWFAGSRISGSLCSEVETAAGRERGTPTVWISSLTTWAGCRNDDGLRTMAVSRGEEPSCSLLASTDMSTLHGGDDVTRVRLGGPRVVIAIPGRGVLDTTALADEYIYRVVPRGRDLILDVTDVGFLGVQGFRAVMALAAGFGTAGLKRVLSAGQSVYSLVRLVGRRDALRTLVLLAEELQRSGEPAAARDDRRL
jgi:hypothetical protein